jgi:DUF1680 family protein
MLEQCVSEGAIKRTIWEGQLINAAHPKARIGDTAFPHMLLLQGHLFWSYIKTHHVTGRDESCEIRSKTARTATTVQEAHPGTKMRK